MGFFDNIFGKSKSEKEFILEETPCKTQQELLERYGAIALEKQSSFYNDVVQYRGWNADIVEGKISFGDDYEFEMQILGTFSHSSQTWLWAWANEVSEIPENVMRQALQLRKYGETHQNSFLTERTFDFSENELHQIGLITSGMFGADAYYLADYGDGVMVVTMVGEEIKKHRKDTATQILTLFPEFISYFEVNHRNALYQYLKLKRFDISEQGEKITATRGGNVINASFDNENRLIELKGNITENS